MACAGGFKGMEWALRSHRPQEPLQGDLHDLLRLPHDVGPTLFGEERVDSSQSGLRPTDVIGG